MRTTPAREDALQRIREERSRQVQGYGANDDLLLGFGDSLSIPWLRPYSDSDNDRVEAAFRADYERFETTHGKPTWMHLIREEVAELFATREPGDTVAEAVQVAALCVSLVEHLLETEGGLWCRE